MNIKRLNRSPWIFIINEDELKTLSKDKSGKWMYFFDSKDIAESVCTKAVIEGIVPESKYSNSDTGVCCFYLNADDNEAHKRCIQFFLDNNLIKKTKAGKFYNISFKKNTQTRNNEYGDNFVADIKLADFIDLNTGEFLK